MRCNVIRIIEKGADTVRGNVSRLKLVLMLSRLSLAVMLSRLKVKGNLLRL